MSSFATAQPEYAAHNIACFPVDRDSKKPSVKSPDRVGLRGSSQLTLRFAAADALGFWAGPRNAITVLDVDDEPGSKGERILNDLGSRHGHSKFIVRTSSGKFHAYYRNNSEPRLIRLYGKDGPAVDLLGSGLVIAPPSHMTRGNYEIVHGSMDDLDRLTTLKDLPIGEEGRKGSGLEKKGGVAQGTRNASLFRHCLRVARHCDSLDDVIDDARSFCDNEMLKPLSDAEIVRTATSAWGYEERQTNWVGNGDVAERWLIRNNQDAYLLYRLAKMSNSWRDEFLMTWNMGESFGWGDKRTKAARDFLIGNRFIRMVLPSDGKAPALYGWSTPSIPSP